MLKLNKLIKSFAGKFDPVLQGIDLSLKSGEFCVIIGSNGSGKSTLMRCISGEYLVDTGTIEMNKNAVISSITQDVNKGTIPEMTLLENISLSRIANKSASLKLYNHNKDEIITIIKELNLGLEAYIDQPLSVLSGGQRQMIATLMAFSSKPEILLLDEHTSALDPKHQHLLMEYTASHINKYNITSLMITHKLEDAVRYGNRLIMLHQGRIVLDLNEQEKKKLDANALLNLFHQHEDQI
jgi:putative tryptophan/tyrosine transport system ATP-binding protein